ncbi:MAG: hypothetical protein QXI19_05950 [Candidatus Caldarchaeum sp.]
MRVKLSSRAKRIRSQPDRWLTLSNTARWMNVPRSTVQRWMNEGLITFRQEHTHRPMISANSVIEMVIRQNPDIPAHVIWKALSQSYVGPILLRPIQVKRLLRWDSKKLRKSGLLRIRLPFVNSHYYFPEQVRQVQNEPWQKYMQALEELG